MSKAFKLVWPLHAKISISFYLPIKSAFNREKFNTPLATGRNHWIPFFPMCIPVFTISSASKKRSCSKRHLAMVLDIVLETSFHSYEQS